MKKILLAISFATLLISASCTENDSLLSTQNSVESNSSDGVFARINNNDGRLLTDDQIESIGVKHNEFVLLALQNIDSQSENLNGDFNIFFNDLANSNDVDYHFENEPNTYQEDYEILQSKLEDSSSKNYFDKVDLFLNDDSEYKSVETISLFLKNLERQFKENTNSVRDYEAFLVYSSVLRHSAEFWLPEDLGGQGNFDSFSRAAPKPGWKKCLTDVLESDGMSGSVGFLVGAGFAAAATGPVAPITFVAAIAVEAGAASTWTYFRSNNC